MDLSIIIVNTHNEDDLRACLASLAKSSTRAVWEVVIVNNGYREAHKSLLDDYANMTVRITQTRENRGYGAACNAGAKEACGDILVFSNPDILYGASTIEDISVHFKEHSATGIVSPLLLLPPEERVQPFSFGREVTPLRIVTRKFLPTEQELLNRIAPRFTNVDWVAGAVLAVRSALFEDLGSFDEQFFLYFEDNDLCKRVKDHGEDVILLHWSSVEHTGHRGESGKTTRHERKEQKQRYFQSQHRYLAKHYGHLAALLLSPLRALYMLSK